MAIFVLVKCCQLREAKDFIYNHDKAHYKHQKVTIDKRLASGMKLSIGEFTIQSRITKIDTRK